MKEQTPSTIQSLPSPQSAKLVGGNTITGTAERREVAVNIYPKAAAASIISCGWLAGLCGMMLVVLCYHLKLILLILKRRTTNQWPLQGLNNLVVWYPVKYNFYASFSQKRHLVLLQSYISDLFALTSITTFFL